MTHRRIPAKLLLKLFSKINIKQCLENLMRIMELFFRPFENVNVFFHAKIGTTKNYWNGPSDISF